jgi:SAM-dependent methyltransferase
MQLKPQSSSANGRLWGARARDWADIQEGQTKPVYEAALARTGVGPGTRYLDVGCGSGVAAHLAATRGARVSGIDAAEALIAIARDNTPGGEFQVCDLEALPFAGDAFDVVTGFNSFQYAANPTVALKEAGRVTRAGGWIVVMTWGPPESAPATAMVRALGPVLPPPPPGAPGPFALSDEATLRAFVADAGLEPSDVFDVDCQWAYPDEATAIRGFNSAGVATRAIEHSGEAAVTEAHRNALKQFRQADGRYLIGACFRCLLARPHS